MFRYRFLLILLLVFSGSFISIKGQDCDCYKTTRAQGVKLMQQKQYAKAIQFFDAAADCPDKPANDDLAQKKEECRRAIRQAEDARRQEETARQAEQRRQQEAANARRKESELEAKGYMDINYINFGNQDNKREVLTWYGGTLYDDEMRYLAPKIRYTGLASVSKSITLYWKIFRPDGTLCRNDSASPEGFTFSGTYTVEPGSDKTLVLGGWGTENGGYYKPGRYRFELYFKGNLLRTEYVEIKAKTTTTSRTAEIKEVKVDHNVYVDGKKGMNIHVNFSIDNCMDDQCDALAYFYYANGSPIKDTNSSYNTADGNVVGSKSFKPGYPKTTYNDLIIFMPYSEIHSTTTTGTVAMYFLVELYSYTAKQFVGNKIKVTFNMTY